MARDNRATDDESLPGRDGAFDDETRFSRRPFVKLAGATAAGTALAGCTGGGGGDEGTPEGGETVALGGGETTTGGGTESKPLSGVGWKFTDTQSLHSPRAKRTMRKLVSQYNNQTGASLNLTIGPGSWDKKFPVLFKNNKYPVVWTPDLKPVGPLYTLLLENDLQYHWSEMQGWIDDDLLSALEWTVDGEQSPMQIGFQGWREKGMTDVALGAMCSNLYFSSYWIANRDHFEEAGLDPDEDFPPKNYDDMIRVGKELDEKAPSSTGLQLPGSSDINDCGLPPLAINTAQGPEGLEFTADWSTTRLDNDVWTRVAQAYIDTYREHGLGSPETPTISDESETVLFAKGDISMANVEPLTIPLVKDQNPEMIENQVAMWGPNYLLDGEGDNWEPGLSNPFFYGVGKKPPQADQAKWDRKIDAAMKFYNGFMMNKDFQEFNYPNDFGLAPAREDTFDPIIERMDQEYPDHMIASVVKQLKETSFAFAGHPAATPGDQISAQMELALKGEQSGQEAMEKAKAQFQKVIDGTIFGQG